MKRKVKFFLAGTFIFFYFCILVYLFVKWNREDHLFIDLVSDIKRGNNMTENNEDSLILASMHAVHFVLHRNSLASLYKDDNFNSSWIQSSESELEYVRGACGSYSMVLARVLKAEGFKVRIGQMLTDQTHANHIILEVRKTNGSWVVLDPFYDLFFRNVDGSLASFDEVRQHWDSYKNDVPDNYYHEYHYTAIRYTNWERFPIAGPMVRKILTWIMGEEKTAALSLRPYILNKYRVFFFVVMLFYFPAILTVLFIRKGILKYFFKPSRKPAVY